jgi:TatD DNase family protein
MSIIDTHAHLDAPEFRDDLEDVLERARRAGVGRIICVGTDLGSSRRCVELARHHAGMVWAAAGIHPNDWSSTAPGDFAELERLAALPEVVAVGETGLDFYRDRTPPEVQAAGFRRHMELALALDKPLIVHARKSDEQVLEELARAGAGLRGVRHCFDGTPEIAEGYLACGFSVAVGGIVTRPGYKRLKAALCALPADRLMVETDCPYQTPASRAGSRNEPAFIVETLRALAELRGETLEQVATSTTVAAEALLFPGPDRSVA